MTRSFQRRWMVWLALIGAAALLLLMATRTPRVELLVQAPGTPTPRFSFLGSPVRSTLRNLRVKLFGPPRTITIAAEVFECYESFALANVPLSAPLAIDRNSTRLFLLDTNQLAVLRHNMQSNTFTITSPSARLSDGQSAKMSVYESVLRGGAWRQIRVEFDVAARAQASAVDLTAFFTITAALTNSFVSSATNAVSIRTNLAVGARAQIPQDHRLFLLHSNAADGKRVGVIVTANIREPKK